MPDIRPNEPDTNEPIPTPTDDTGIASGLGSSEDGPAQPSAIEPSTDPASEPASDEPDRVNVSTPTASAYWARHFQVAVEQMHEAVDAVGNDPQRVAAHLGKPWPYTDSGIV